jgi:hypothetical protein
MRHRRLASSRANQPAVDAAGLALRRPVGSSPAAPHEAPPGPRHLGKRRAVVLRSFRRHGKAPSTATDNVSGQSALGQAEAAWEDAAKIDDDEDVMEGERLERAPGAQRRGLRCKKTSGK